MDIALNSDISAVDFNGTDIAAVEFDGVELWHKIYWAPKTWIGLTDFRPIYISGQMVKTFIFRLVQTNMSLINQRQHGYQRHGTV